MNNRQLGKSGLTTPPLALGGNVFGWTADRDQSFAVLDTFADAGGCLIDTADVYSRWIPGHQGGESEVVMGEWMKHSGRRSDMLIATKVGLLDGPTGTGLQPAHILASVEQSLKRLQIDVIDIYFAHKEDPDTPLEATLEAFDSLVRAGKVRALGVSNFSTEAVTEALRICNANGWARFEVMQPHYNLLERSDFETRLQPICLAENIAVIPYYSLASGFLTGKYRTEADFGKSVRGNRLGGYLEGNGLPVLKVMDEIAAETGASHAAIALSWLASRPTIAAPIASATSPAQLKEQLSSLTLALNDDQLQRLENASA